MTVFAVFLAVVPYFVTPSGILVFQLFFTVFAPTGYPAVAVIFSHFPVLTRFRYTSFGYALSRACMYVVTAFGLVYLVGSFGNWGLLFIMVPAITGCAFGRRHFEQLEIATGNYSQKIPVDTQ